MQTINPIKNTFGARILTPARRTVTKISAVVSIATYAIAGIASLRSIKGYPDLFRDLKSELGINPSLRLISDGSKEGADILGRARLLDNLVEVNIYPSSRPPHAVYNFNNTLIHECRHIWQHEAGITSEGPNFYRIIAKEVDDYAPRNEAEALILNYHRDSYSYLAYTMSWREVDARAYSAWYLNERPLGLDYVQPPTDSELLADIIEHQGTSSFVSEKAAFALMFQRLVAAEVRIKKYAPVRNR